jgi:pyrroline-5-carboxylate reductase
MSNAVIAFAGSGNLTQALITGLLSNQYDPQKIWAADPDREKLQVLSQRFGVKTTQNNLEAIQQADVVLLAVKPVHLQTLCTEIKALVLQRRPLVISVAAGATIALLEKWLGSYATIVRAMPNTPAMVGAGATGLYADSAVTTAQKELAEVIFRAVGMTVWAADENQLDLICAVSGCGPGYIFLIMEAIEEAARQKGMNAQRSRLLTAQTFLGAAKLALESDHPLAELRRQVTSLKGATEKAVQILEQGGIRSLLADAIEGAAERCSEIAKELAEPMIK